jgi:hypothetical protein
MWKRDACLPACLSNSMEKRPRHSNSLYLIIRVIGLNVFLFGDFSPFKRNIFKMLKEELILRKSTLIYVQSALRNLL